MNTDTTAADFLKWQRMDAQRREMRALARDRALRDLAERHAREYQELVEVYASELLSEIDEPIPFELVAS